MADTFIDHTFDFLSLIGTIFLFGSFAVEGTYVRLEDKNIEDLDLFRTFSVMTSGGTYNAGRARFPTPLMLALLYI